MLLQLNPSIPLSTPKGEGLAWLVIDSGQEHDLQWVVAIDETGEVWTFSNKDVRAQKNITMGRKLKEEELNHNATCKICHKDFYSPIAGSPYFISACSMECMLIETRYK